MFIKTKNGTVEVKSSRIMAAYRMASDLRFTGKAPNAEQIEALRWVERTTGMDKYALANMSGDAMLMTSAQQLVLAVWMWCDVCIEAHLS